MAITVPTTYDAIALTEFKGRLDAGQGADILHRILLNTNFAYATCRWPVLDAAPYSESTKTQHIYYAPLPVSGDSIDYDFHFCTWRSTTSVNVSVDISTSTTTSLPGATWTLQTTATSSGANNDQQWTATVTSLSGSVKYVKLDFTISSGSCQVQHIQVRPAVMTSIAAGTSKASGFIAYEDGVLDGTAGAPVHTEFFNRAWKNAASVMNDRQVCLFAYLWPDYATTVRLDQSGAQNVQRFWMAPGWFPGGRGETITARCRANTNGAGTDHELWFGTRSGATLASSLTADNTDKTGTFALDDDVPVWTVGCEWGNNTDPLEPFYIGMWHTYSEPTGPIMTAPTPPALLEDLIGLNSFVESVCVGKSGPAAYRGWPQPASVFDYAAAGGSDWHLVKVLGPGMHSGRGMYARSIETASTGTQNDVSAYSATSGGTASDEIIVRSPWSEGTDTTPVDSDQTQVAIVKNGETYDASPSAAQDRLFELPSGLGTNTEVFQLDVCHGFGLQTVVKFPLA